MSNENPDAPIKPQVIDLDAEDVVVDDVEAASPILPPEPAKSSALPTWWLLVAALLGGGAIGAWVYKDFLSGYLPSTEVLAAHSRIDTREAQPKTLAGTIPPGSGTPDHWT